MSNPANENRPSLPATSSRPATGSPSAIPQSPFPTPHSSTVNFSTIPETLKRTNRWLLWRYRRSPTGTLGRIPLRTCGRRANPADPKTWTTLEVVKSTYEQSLHGPEPFDGIAFALGEGFTALELDQIFPVSSTLNPEPRTLNQNPPLVWCAQLVADFCTYAELAPEGDVLKLIVRCTAAGPNLEPTPHPAGGTMAVWHQNRFVCITGHPWPADAHQAIEDRTDKLQQLIAHLRSGQSNPLAPRGDIGCEASANELAELRRTELRSAEAAARQAADESRQLKSELESLIASLPTETLHNLADTKPISGDVPRPTSMRHAAPAESQPLPLSLCLSAPPPSSPDPQAPEDDPRIADQIVELALTEFRLGRTPADETFAVSRHGPNIAHMLRGGSAPLRKALARDFRRRYGRTLNSSALTDALNVIEAEAAELEPEEVALRVACVPLAGLGAIGCAGAPANEEQDHELRNASPQSETPNTKHETPSRDAESEFQTCEAIVIDLGRPDGQTVIVTPDGWRILDHSPVLFRRTSLTAQLPLPVPGGRLDQLRALVNVSDEGYQMLRGWLVAALFPSIAHPILVLRGEQGTGKSMALRMLAGLVDPSAALSLSEPNDSEHWVMMAHGGWCLPLDNVAGISPWFSEALCRAVTGDGIVRRRLYTDGDFAVIAFRRVLALTCINLGPIAEDLAARMLPVGLELIDKPARLPESRLLARFEALKPQLFGALLNEVAATLRNLPNVHLEELPRMADFARLLAALPCETPPALSTVEGNTKHETLLNHEPPTTIPPTLNPEPRTLNTPLAIYLRLIDRLSLEVAEGDPVVAAVSEFMSTRDSWQGKATELLSLLVRPEESRGWPKTGQYLTVRLNQIASALRTMGIAIGHTRASDYMRSRQVVLKSIHTESP